MKKLMSLLVLPTLLYAVSSSAADALTCSATINNNGVLSEEKTAILVNRAPRHLKLSDGIVVSLQRTAKFSNYVDIRVSKYGKNVLLVISKAEDASTEIAIPDGKRTIGISCEQGDTIN